MSREDLVTMTGTITNVMTGGDFEVQTPEGHKILARRSGRMRRFRERVVEGDKVTVGVSPYDPTRGLITEKIK